MNTTTTLHVYDTNEDLFAALSRVFLLREADGTRWVTLQERSGVEITFFAADPVVEDVPAVGLASAEEVLA